MIRDVTIFLVRDIRWLQQLIVPFNSSGEYIAICYSVESHIVLILTLCTFYHILLSQFDSRHSLWFVTSQTASTHSPFIVMPIKDVETPYPVIDKDPHFFRVVRYFRPSDYASWAAGAAAAPAIMLGFGKYLLKEWRRGVLGRLEFFWTYIARRASSFTQGSTTCEADQHLLVGQITLYTPSLVMSTYTPLVKLIVPCTSL